MKIIDTFKLESVLLQNWAQFFDKTLLIKRVLEDIKEDNYRSIDEVSRLPETMSFMVTRFLIKDNTNFEIWIEFSAPKNNKVVIGTHIYHSDLNGKFNLTDAYGVIFKTQN